MKLPDQAVGEATLHPSLRLLALLGGTWIIGALWPIPPTLWRLMTLQGDGGLPGRREIDSWFDPNFAPVLGTMASHTVLVSGALAVFCVVCSALDRGDWRRITLLSGFSTASMNLLDDLTEPESWPMTTLLQLIVVTLLFRVLRPLSSGDS